MSMELRVTLQIGHVREVAIKIKYKERNGRMKYVRRKEQVAK